MENFLEVYNPQNAKSLTEDQVSAMQNLTADEIHALAKKYPNPAIQKTYLILKDKNKTGKTQLYPRSTWPNLSSLIRIGQVQFIPLTFAALFNNSMRDVKLPVGPAQDLTLHDLNTAPGLKKAEEQNLTVTDKGVGVGDNDEDDFDEVALEAAKKAGGKVVTKAAKPIPGKKAGK
jgi:hypothetical protein